MESKNDSNLMYSEYMGNHNPTRCLSKEKPSMVFHRSQVLERISNLIPQLKEAENNLDLSQDNDIESFDENEAYVEMNVAIVNSLDNGEDVYSDDQESEDESESSDIEAFSSLKSEIEAQLKPSVKICSKNKSKIEVIDEEIGLDVEKNELNCIDIKDSSSHNLKSLDCSSGAGVQDKGNL